MNKKEMTLSEFEKYVQKRQNIPHNIAGFEDQVLVCSPYFQAPPSKTKAICVNSCKDPSKFKEAINKKEYTGLFKSDIVGKHFQKTHMGTFPVTFAFVLHDKKVMYGLISNVDENDHVHFLPMKKTLQDKENGYIKMNTLSILAITFQVDRRIDYDSEEDTASG